MTYDEDEWADWDAAEHDAVSREQAEEYAAEVAEQERQGAEIDEAVSSTGHMPGHFDNEPAEVQPSTSEIPDVIARAAAPDRILAAFSRLLVVVDEGSERAEMPAVRRGSLLAHALSHITGSLAGQVWGASTITTSALVGVFESAVTSTKANAANLAQSDGTSPDAARQSPEDGPEVDR